MDLDQHPTVRAYRERRSQTNANVAPPPEQALNADWLRQLCLECGADDVGFVSVSRPAMAPHRADIARLMPGTRSLISLVARMHREPVKSTVRSVANHEFHEAYQAVNEASREIVRRLENLGIPALNSVAAFPMEVQDFPGKSWPISHKPIAEAAGLGKMGFHRNLIHPKFGNFIVLDTILVGRDIATETMPIDFSPCLDCKLCVAACPVEAIGPDGSFNFSACYTHNYRDFLGGFLDWTEQVAEASDRHDLRQRLTEGEIVSVWQSLSYKPGYKAAYCISVCPAGEDVIAPYLEDRIAYVNNTVKPLQDKSETVYVLPGSDAEAFMSERFPAKRIKTVPWTIRARDLFSFLFNITLTFQRRKARGLNAVYHFTFTGRTPLTATISVKRNTLKVDLGHAGSADVHVTADADSWMSWLKSEFALDEAIAIGSIRIDGSRDLFDRLGQCFPSYDD